MEILIDSVNFRKVLSTFNYTIDLNIQIYYEINTLKYNEIHNSNHKSPKSRLDFKSCQPKLLVSDLSQHKRSGHK